MGEIIENSAVSYAPVVLFTYKRLSTLEQTIQALQANSLAKDTELYIFSDGPKYKEDEAIVNNIRSYIKSVAGFKKVQVFEATVNKGLASSIIDGVTQIMQFSETVIVLEDDLLTTPNFLSFMNACLAKYKTMEQVFSVSAYSFNLGVVSGYLDDAYLLNRGWSWGWATWKGRWKTIDWEVKDYPSFVKDANRKRGFANGGSDLNKMLEKQMNGKLDSWAIRWFYHQFKVGGLTVYPILSKINNNGFDQDATHTTGSSTRYLPMMDTSYENEFRLPELVKVSVEYQDRFKQKMGLKARIISKIETLLKQIFS